MFIEAVDLIKPYGIVVDDKEERCRYDSGITHCNAFNTSQEIIIVSKLLTTVHYEFLERPHSKVFLTLQFDSDGINHILKVGI